MRNPGAPGAALGGPSLNNITFAGSSDVGNRSVAIGYTRTITPTLVADIRFGYVRYRVNVLPSGLGTSPAKDTKLSSSNIGADPDQS